MIRKLPNQIKIIERCGNKLPFVVEVRKNLQEHLDVGKRLMQSKITFTYHVAGRYLTNKRAVRAAHTAAKKHGGHVVGVFGFLTLEPYPVPRASSK